MFRALHPAHKASSELKFRLRLLQFACLFTSCTAPENSGSLWCSPTAFAQGISFERGGQAEVVSEKRKVDPEEHETDTEDSPHSPVPDTFKLSLLDTLPSFMALSAAQNAGQESNVTVTWMQLAGLYMAQAAIDDGLKHGRIRADVIDQAFGRWTFNPDLEVDDTTDEWQVNAMFWADDELLPGWEEIKRKHQQILVRISH